MGGGWGSCSIFLGSGLEYGVTGIRHGWVRVRWAGFGNRVGHSGLYGCFFLETRTWAGDWVYRAEVMNSFLHEMLRCVMCDCD
jgi:hypothetical protein